MTIRVHQIWLQGREAIPSDILPSMQTWIEATSTRRNYGYVFWDDQAIRELLAGTPVPRIAEIYERLPDPRPRQPVVAVRLPSAHEEVDGAGETACPAQGVNGTRE